MDRDHQVIVAVGVSSQAPDVEHLAPMLERIAASAMRRPVPVLPFFGWETHHEPGLVIDPVALPGTIRRCQRQLAALASGEKGFSESLGSGRT